MCTSNGCTCLGKVVKEDLSKKVTLKPKLEWRESVSYGSSGGISFQVARIASAIS